MKRLKITMEWPRDTNSMREYVELRGNETDEELQQIASDVFSNYSNYGYEVIDTVD
jgi:hypothetical protein